MNAIRQRDICLSIIALAVLVGLSYCASIAQRGATTTLRSACQKAGGVFASGGKPAGEYELCLTSREQAQRLIEAIWREDAALTPNSARESR